MPALATHVFHSEKCLAKLKPELEKRGIEPTKDFAGLVGAAAISHDTLGLLLGTGYDRCFVDAHEKNTDAYFLAMIAYIKEHGLRENPNAMAFLYGQIMHYALDIKAHPLIYYMTERHPAKFLVSALSAHTLFEAWMDRENEKKENITDRRYIFRKKVGDGGIDDMVDAVYERVYGLKKAAAGYRHGINIWAFYQLRLRKTMLNHVKQYLPDFQAMLNHEGEAFQHPVTGEPMHASFQQLHDASIDLACELILAVNANIYDGADNEDLLKQAFANSYDTGVAWRDLRLKQYFKEY